MKWRTFASRARTVFGAYAAAEGCSFGAHQYRISEMHHAPRRSMEEGFDYDGHFSWFAREITHEPDPKRLFEDAFNATAIGNIPRSSALHMLQFYLTARERDAFPGESYPPEVTRTAETLLRRLEKTHGLRFRVHDTTRSEYDDTNDGKTVRALRKALITITNKVDQKGFSKKAFSKENDSAVRDFLVDGAGGSQGGVETHKGVDTPTTADFIRTNKFDMNPYYKPIAFQLLIAAFRWSAEHRLKRAGFEKKTDPAVGIVVWVRPPRGLKEVKGSGHMNHKENGNPKDHDKKIPSINPKDKNPRNVDNNPNTISDRYDPVVFLHGLGIGIAPYAEYVAGLPDDRPVVAPEWPNISYNWDDRSHRYPSPSELANFLERVTRRAAEDALARDLGDENLELPINSIVAATRNTKCDVIAHSYGTVCLTSFRRHYPNSVRRCVYIDPVCFLPSFGSYLRYGFDDHLTTWREMREHLSLRSSDPSEPMSFMNLILASWFVKGDASTQQLMKRLLFPHEAWERGPLKENDMVVLSGLDEIVGSTAIAERFTKAFPKCSVILQPQWQHGGFLLEPDPDMINDHIVRHATGGKNNGDCLPRGKQGLVKRAWARGFAKKKKRKRNE